MGFQYTNQYYLTNGILTESVCKLKDFSKEAFIAYEVLRLMGGKPLFFEDHISRLYNSLNSLNVDCSGFKQVDLFKQLSLLCSSNDVFIGNIEIRVVVINNVIDTTYIGFIPHKYPNPVDYINGVKTCLVQVNRENPNLKLKGTIARKISDKKIQEEGCHEVLLVNDSGLITEGSRSNVFFIVDGKVFTASSDFVLEGITRKYVIKALKNIAVTIEYNPVNTHDLNGIDAAFICGTSPGVMPINSIGNKQLDTANSILRACMQAFNEELVKYLSD